MSSSSTKQKLLVAAQVGLVGASVLFGGPATWAIVAAGLTYRVLKNEQKATNNG